MSYTIGKEYKEKFCSVCKKNFSPDDQTENPIMSKKDAKEYGIKVGEYICLGCIIDWVDKKDSSMPFINKQESPLLKELREEAKRVMHRFHNRNSRV